MRLADRTELLGGVIVRGERELEAGCCCSNITRILM